MERTEKWRPDRNLGIYQRLKPGLAGTGALAKRDFPLAGGINQDMQLNGKILDDIQSRPAEVPLRIDCVGVSGLRRQLRLADRTNGTQVTVASVDLGVDLPASTKGTHMSRLVEALDEWDDELGRQSMHALLSSMRERLKAGRAWARFGFPYLIRKASPTGGGQACMAYDCGVTGELSDNGLEFLLELAVPVMTVCPCSKAISEEGAHSQRALIRMKIRIAGFAWLEEFVEIAEASASSEVYPLLKRPDEKFVTEHAFGRPAFVEDVVRRVAAALASRAEVLQYEVEVESMESIHNHNAFARIKGGKRSSRD